MNVSIIINVRNGEKYIAEAINSALIQTYKDFEIIIFDNNSDDKTKKVIENFKDSRIKYFFSEKYLSLGEARNKAIKKSNFDLIASGKHPNYQFIKRNYKKGRINLYKIDVF